MTNSELENQSKESVRLIDFFFFLEIKYVDYLSDKMKS